MTRSPCGKGSKMPKSKTVQSFLLKDIDWQRGQDKAFFFKLEYGMKTLPIHIYIGMLSS